MRHLIQYSIYESESIDIMYHVSLCLNRESILKNGLDASGSSAWDDNYDKGTYLWDNIMDARKYGFGNGDPFDIWEVDVTHYGLEDDKVTKGAYLITEPISIEDIKLSEKHEDDVTNPMNEGMMSNGMVLVTGEKTSDGTTPLYVFSVYKVLSMDRKKADNTDGDAAQMVLLGDDCYILSIEDGKLVSRKKGFGSRSGMIKSLGMSGKNVQGDRPKIVLNSKNDKTPLYWEALKCDNIGQVMSRMSDKIMGIPNVKWNY